MPIFLPSFSTKIHLVLIQPRFKKNKADRPETVRIPYTRVSRIDVHSRQFLKAMGIVAKTNPDEADQVSSETLGVSRKRRRANSFYEYIDSYESTQGMSPSRPASPLLTQW